MCQKNKIGEFTDKLKYKLKFISSNDWQISKVYLKSISEIEK